MWRMFLGPFAPRCLTLNTPDPPLNMSSTSIYQTSTCSLKSQSEYCLCSQPIFATPQFAKHNFLIAASSPYPWGLTSTSTVSEVRTSTRYSLDWPLTAQPGKPPHRVHIPNPWSSLHHTTITITSRDCGPSANVTKPSTTSDNQTQKPRPFSPQQFPHNIASPSP